MGLDYSQSHDLCPRNTPSTLVMRSTDWMPALSSNSVATGTSVTNLDLPPVYDQFIIDVHIVQPSILPFSCIAVLCSVISLPPSLLLISSHLYDLFSLPLFHPIAVSFHWACIFTDEGHSIIILFSNLVAIGACMSGMNILVSIGA